jgi:hypothetical protein
MTKKLLSIALTVPMVCLAMACGGGTPKPRLRGEGSRGAGCPEAPAAETPEAPAGDAPAEGAAPAEGGGEEKGGGDEKKE